MNELVTKIYENIFSCKRLLARHEEMSAELRAKIAQLELQAKAEEEAASDTPDKLCVLRREDWAAGEGYILGEAKGEIA